MKYAKLARLTYLIRLVKGEKVVGSITAFCQSRGVANAKLFAIGSVENPIVAHYLVNTKKYSEQMLKGIFEVTGLLGNVALFENKPLVHAHVSLSDEKMRGFGGHLVEAEVSATVEVIIEAFSTKFQKKFDKKIGLKLWDLSEEMV